jgi:aryl-alcohol dehydrogenase-like predicted oxidoreductase
MKRRKLGTLEVSEMGFGCMNVSGNYGPATDKNQGIWVIRAAHEKGVTFFDTANFTVPTQTKSLSERRSRLSATGSPSQPNLASTMNRAALFLTADRSIRKVVEESLKRLRTDRIDLYYQHRVDPNLPIEDVAGAVKELMIAEGKVLHFGLSEASAKTIRRAHAIQTVSAVQTEYSLMNRM